MATALPSKDRSEVLRLIGLGLDSATIAERMQVKAGTVRQIKARQLKSRKQERFVQLETTVRWLVKQVEDLRRDLALQDVRFLRALTRTSTVSSFATRSDAQRS
jgi:hypothetical protein